MKIQFSLRGVLIFILALAFFLGLNCIERQTSIVLKNDGISYFEEICLQGFPLPWRKVLKIYPEWHEMGYGFSRVFMVIDFVLCIFFSLVLAWLIGRCFNYFSRNRMTSAGDDGR